MVFFTGPPTLSKPIVRKKKKVSLFFALVLNDSYRYIKSERWYCSTCAESFPISIKNGNINGTTGDGKINAFSYYAVTWGDHTGFSEDTSKNISPCFPQMKQGSSSLLYRPKGNIYLRVYESLLATVIFSAVTLPV